MNQIIDVHTHMFNGHYVPLRDIFFYKFGLSKKKSKVLSILVNYAVRDRPVSDILDILDTSDEEWKSRDEHSRNEKVDRFVEHFYNILVDSIVKDMAVYNRHKTYININSSKLLEAYLDLIEIDAEEEGYSFDRNKYKEELFENLLIEDTLDKKSTQLNELDMILCKGKPSLKRVLMSISGYLSFVGKMLLHEKELADHLIGRNYDTEDRPALTIHLMMDMEPAFCALGGNTPPKLDFQTEQIPRAIEVSKNSDGYLLGFVAFDPRRGKKGLEIVKYGLEVGNIGVKLYPPMGYQPNDFEKFPILHELYSYCIENSIPIMVHCTPVGFDAKKDAAFGLKSDPGYWKDVLEKYNELTLCFGHAGGGDYNVEYKDDDGNRKSICFKGWYEEHDNGETGWNSALNYPKKIIELCQKYPNVYTDMSYLHAMIDNNNGERNNFINRLKNAVGITSNNSYDFGNKIMYGSDWHMSQIVNRTNEYLNMFQKIFNDEEKLKPYKDGFFFSNAVRYLNLEKYITKQENSKWPLHSHAGLNHLKKIVEQSGLS